MSKSKILHKIATAKPREGRNIMGCPESWYDSYYAIGQTFSRKELDDMTEKELNNLVKLADSMSEAFY